MTRQRGGALATGLMLLAVITLLGLAAAAAAQVELQLARNEQFRENAATAASAGIEIAIRHVIASAPESVPARLHIEMPGSTERIELTLRFLGYGPALPQAPGSGLGGAHFEIVSTGRAARGATDRQRVLLLHAVRNPDAETADCEPVVPGVRCARDGEWRRLSWQRLPSP